MNKYGLVRRNLTRFAQYMVGGGAQFWSGYASFALFDAIFGWVFWQAKVLSYVIGVTANFALQRNWVFKERKSSKNAQETASKFYVLMAFNFGIDYMIVAGLREIGVSPYIGQFISAGFFTVWNYALFSLWVFKKHKKAMKKA